MNSLCRITTTISVPKINRYVCFHSLFDFFVFAEKFTDTDDRVKAIKDRSKLFQRYVSGNKECEIAMLEMFANSLKLFDYPKGN